MSWDQRPADDRSAVYCDFSCGSAPLQVIQGRLSVGGFVAFSSLTAMGYAAILRVLGFWEKMQKAAVLLNRLNDVFEQEPEQGHDRSRLIPVHSLEGRIELRGVQFQIWRARNHPTF